MTFTFIASLYAAQWTYSRSGEAGIILQRSIWGGMLVVYLATALASIWLFVTVARGEKLAFQLPHFHFENAVWRVIGFIAFVAITLSDPLCKV